MRFSVILPVLFQALATVAAAGDGTIDLLPDPAASPGITITESGSYVLVDNITMGQAAPCIVVDADNVTLDLNGHTVTSPQITSGTMAVIQFNGGRSGLVLRNGSIVSSGRGSGADGLRIDGSRSVVEDIRITSCTYGIRLNGSDSRVENCTVAENNAGLTINGSRNLVRNCQLLSSFFEGISLNGNAQKPVTGCRIEGNICSGNEGAGIFLHETSTANSILNNTVTSNIYGIFMFSGQAIFLGNQAAGNRVQNYYGVPAALIVSLSTATAPPPAGANVQP